MDKELAHIFEMGADIDFADGSKMFSDKNIQAFYEVDNAIRAKDMTVSEVKKYMNERVYADEADFIFGLPMVEVERELFNRKLFYMINKVKTENTIRCKRCKSTNTEWKMKQYRSSDEGASIKIQCNDCGFIEIRG